MCFALPNVNLVATDCVGIKSEYHITGWIVKEKSCEKVYCLNIEKLSCS